MKQKIDNKRDANFHSLYQKLCIKSVMTKSVVLTMSPSPSMEKCPLLFILGKINLPGRESLGASPRELMYALGRLDPM